MTRRVYWKKGMKLTDDILRLSDSYHAALVNHAFTLAAVGRFGLLPSKHPFQISLDINKNIIEVVALDCLGLTKNGQLIDISLDSRFSHIGDTRVAIPSQTDDRNYLLLVSVTDQWRDLGDSSCEPQWQCSLIEENTPIPEDALPLARIINDMGWREDDINFLPPCMFLSSHEKYVSLCNAFRELLGKMEQLVYNKLNTESGDAKRLLWPEIKRLVIVMDKESDTLTPMSLLAKIQECISDFHCACTLDEFLGLSEADKYAEFVRIPYNYKDCYVKIKEGIELLTEICHKLENITLVSSDVKELSTPWIKESDLHAYATSNNVRLEVMGIDPGAIGYYSLDGSEPAKPLLSGRFIPIDPGFNKTRAKEDDRTYVVKMKAMVGGTSSKVASYDLKVTKDINKWKGFQI